MSEEQSIAPDIVVASAGAVSAAFSTISVYPLDTIKTYLNKGVTAEGRKLKSALDVLRELNRTNNVTLALYSGVGLKVVMSMLQKFLYFYIYNYLKRIVVKRSATGEFSLVANLAVGYFSALFSVGILTPLEVAQTRQQLEISGTSSLRAILMDMIKTNQCYSGFSTNLILCVNPSIEFSVFDQLKKRRKTKLSDFDAFWLGAFAKAIATIVTFPHVRAKVLQQSGLPRFKGLDSTSVIDNLISTEGIASLFAGMQTQLAKTVIAAAIMHSLKERIEKVVISVLVSRSR